MTDSIYKIRLKKGDTVVVRSGKYKGHTGKVLATHPRLNKVTIEGVNVVKRHVKPTATQTRGGIAELTKPVAVSKVGLFDSSAKKASRIGYTFDKDGNKHRIMKTSGKEIK